MAIDRPNLGLTVLRICLGVFFVFEGLGKVRWFADSSILAARFADWHHAAPVGSLSAWYLDRIADPGLAIFARLVPLGEIVTGIALVIGFWTPLFAFIGFFMALNFQIAGNMIFKYSFLTSGYGLPVLGGTLALAIGGVRTRFSVR
jgi:thiosulfate dehydrogenase [quinone] large subunit